MSHPLDFSLPGIPLLEALTRVRSREELSQVLREIASAYSLPLDDYMAHSGEAVQWLLGQITYRMGRADGDRLLGATLADTASLGSKQLHRVWAWVRLNRDRPDLQTPEFQGPTWQQYTHGVWDTVCLRYQERRSPKAYEKWTQELSDLCDHVNYDAVASLMKRIEQAAAQEAECANEARYGSPIQPFTRWSALRCLLQETLHQIITRTRAELVAARVAAGEGFAEASVRTEVSLTHKAQILRREAMDRIQGRHESSGAIVERLLASLDQGRTDREGPSAEEAKLHYAEFLKRQAISAPLRTDVERLLHDTQAKQRRRNL